MKKIILIIPAFNESEGIERLVGGLTNWITNQNTYDVSYIIINDGSTDDTNKVLNRIGAPHVDLIHNLGIGGAVQTGYRYAYENGYDVAVQFDGDGQHDINSLATIVEPIINGSADFVVGSRYVGLEKSMFQSTVMRRLGISMLSTLLKTVIHTSIKDVTSGFRAGNRQVMELFMTRYPTIYPEPESYVHLYKHGFRIKEVPVNMFERETGESSISPGKSIDYMVQVGMSILMAALIKKEVNK